MALELWHIGLYFGLILAGWIAFEIWDFKTDEKMW